MDCIFSENYLNHCLPLKSYFLSKSSHPNPDDKSWLMKMKILKKQIGLWIRHNTDPGEKVFIAGYGAQIQAYSERISPSIYFNVTQTPLPRTGYMRIFHSKKPDMLVIPLQERYSTTVDAGYSFSYQRAGY